MQNGENIKVGFGNWFVDIGGKNVLIIIALIAALALLHYAQFLEHKDNREDHNKIIAQQAEIIKNQNTLIGQHVQEQNRLDKQRDMLDKYYQWIVDQYGSYKKR